MKPTKLPIYRSRHQILQAVSQNQVTIVESTTGSGKTTLLPILLYEAGYAQNGMIGVTQPRRIAALNISEYIAQTIGKDSGHLVGYKMRFEDTTTPDTRLKIVTDGTLLQEVKSDSVFSQYQVIIVDEAHERSLNIDFLLGVLKKALKERPDFKVVISSATLKTEVFSQYFFNAPLVKIESPIYPVQVIYSPPKSTALEHLIDNIESIIVHGVKQKQIKNVLIFLPGEHYISQTLNRLSSHIALAQCDFFCLYGRLPREQQQKAFLPVPRGRVKIVLSTNIAETSVTIEGVDTVIDSGLAKLNFYNPRTFTASLEEIPISQASAQQRKGRAGRTKAGTCYRLYTRSDFAERPAYSREEIYRTDLAEVVLRMADLGIKDFQNFDFISMPNTQGVRGGIQTLTELQALNKDYSLSSIGQFMAKIPLAPRHSRILWESIQSYPDVLEEVITIIVFLSTHSPFLTPSDKLQEARKCHSKLSSPWGDFISYLNLYREFESQKNPEQFCVRNFLDFRIMKELQHIFSQLKDILSTMQIPILSGGPIENILKSCAKGLVHYVCVHEGRGAYRSLTAERILIHPSSCLFKERPDFLMAGEIIKTSQMFARSVSLVKKEWLMQINPEFSTLFQKKSSKPDDKKSLHNTPLPKNENNLVLGSHKFPIKINQGKKLVSFNYFYLKAFLTTFKNIEDVQNFRSLRGELHLDNTLIFTSLKVDDIIRYCYFTDLPKKISRGLPSSNFHLNSPAQEQELRQQLSNTLDILLPKKHNKKASFIMLNSDGQKTFWFSAEQDLQTATYGSLEAFDHYLEDLGKNGTEKDFQAVSKTYEYIQNLYYY